jgi:MFS family permease
VSERSDHPVLPAHADLRRWGFAVLLAVPVALLAAAAASVVIALLALPVALLLTRDGYLALLAISYGPFAASVALQAIAGAVLAWSIALPLLAWGRERAVVAPAAGAGAGVLGLLAGALSLFGALSVPWRYGPTLPIAPVPALIAAALGLAAGALFLEGGKRASARPPAMPPAGWRDDLRHAVWHLVWFAFPLALLFEGWVALLSVLGRI